MVWGNFLWQKLICDHSWSFLRKNWYWPLLRERIWAECTDALIQNGNFFVVSDFSSFSTETLWAEKKKIAKPVGTSLSLRLASSLDLQRSFRSIPQKFFLTGNRVWHHFMLKFLRIMVLQHNLQAELQQNAVLRPGFEFLKFFLWSDWKNPSLAGWKAVKSPW